MSTQTDQTPAHASDEEPTIGRLVTEIQRDFSQLFRDEIKLAKTEITISIKHGGVGAAFFGGAAFLALLGVIMLSVSIAYFLHFTGLPLAFCFLIVFVLYLLVAGILGFLGLKQVKKVGPPERAIHQAQETKNVLSRG